MSHLFFYSADLPSHLIAHDQTVLPNTLLTLEKAKADFFFFPVYYEVLYEYSEQEYAGMNITPDQVLVARDAFTTCLSEAGELGKKVILLYYRDPDTPLPVPSHCLIFRTSLTASKRQANEWALPAWVEDFKTRVPDAGFRPLGKTQKALVTFRGQSAPLELPLKTQLRQSANRLLSVLGSKKQLPMFYNFGYLARRNALVSCQKNSTLKTDFLITGSSQIQDPVSYKADYVSSMMHNQYNLCASGHGNYSYRLYETMSAGRIPVFINTDCVLPLQNVLSWKKYVVWVEEADIRLTGQIIADFHQRHHPDDFVQLQLDIRSCWEKHLTPQGFFTHFLTDIS